jgi:hypothetical protein
MHRKYCNEKFNIPCSDHHGVPTLERRICFYLGFFTKSDTIKDFKNQGK